MLLELFKPIVRYGGYVLLKRLDRIPLKCEKYFTIPVTYIDI